MLSDLFRALSYLVKLVGMLLITALLGVATIAMWHFYQAERLQNLFRAEGQPVTVQIDRTDRNDRQIWDALGNFVYAGFLYRNQPYEVRCASDTWLSEGDRINLLYHPGLNAFIQPGRAVVSTSTRVVSRLIRWSSMADFSREHSLLAGFLLVALALFFSGGGVIVTLTGWTFIQTIAQLVLGAALAAGALFFTYDTYQYVRYVDELRANGQGMDVRAIDSHRTTHGRRSGHWYTYEATFRFRGQERVVAIDEDEYDRIDGGNHRLVVRYNPALNDFVSAGYTVEWSRLFLPLFFWLLFGLLAFQGLSRKKPQPVGPQPPRTSV